MDSTLPAPIPDYASPAPAPAPPLSLSDILAATDLLLEKESADKATLESIGAISVDDLRTRLVVWGRSGFPNAHAIHSISILPPSVCSDGAVRALEDYIIFCSGKTLTEHVVVLQAKVASDIQIGFANLGASIAIVVSKT